MISFAAEMSPDEFRARFRNADLPIAGAADRLDLTLSDVPIDAVATAGAWDLGDWES